MVNLLSGLTYSTPLGAGSFGQVYLGQDPVHGEVAVKVLSRRPEWSDAQWQVWKKDFLSEAQSLSRASHENVVKVHYINEADDGKTVLICMGYCPGGSLQRPYEAGPMTIVAVRKIATDVLLGLHCLHMRAMIHRDIKPANILLDARSTALIGDFGLVTDRLVLGYASHAGYSDHIAYEIWKGKGTSVKSDIWALGATLYRLLHGQRWYGELPEPKDLIVHGKFAYHLPWLPHIPKRWRRVIRQMMEDDPAKRYASAEAALSAVASLPVTSTWNATVEAGRARWERTKGGRTQIVEWTRLPRQQAWKAWSEPSPGSNGRTMSLGGSNGLVTAKQAIAELESYLS